MSMVPIACPLLGVEEQEAVLRVLISGLLAQGEYVAAFERRFAEVCHVREAVAVSSGTAALHLALLVHGIGPGDEVIKTAFSFAATANVILLVGATSVFVDLEPDTCSRPPLRSSYTPVLAKDAQVSIPLIGMGHHRSFGKSLPGGSMLPLIWTKLRYLSAPSVKEYLLLHLASAAAAIPE